MRIAASLLILACVALPAVAGVKVDTEPDFDIGAYRTYAWKAGTDAARPDVQRWVVAAVERELKAAGLRRVTDRRADIYVVTNTFAELESGVTGSYVATRYDVGLLRADIVMKTKGVLVVDLIDDSSDRPVWRGMASELMQEPSPDKLRKKIDKLVKKMFKSLPR